MDYIELGKTGLKVSPIGLGTWQFGSKAWGWGKTYGREEALSSVKKALDLGINFIDTAEIYGNGESERIVGEAIKGRRNEAIIATKVSPLHLSYNSVIRACERSLERLNIKEIDLYQIHFPNPIIPIKETMKAMNKLLRDGKIRYVGVSNFKLKQLKKAMGALSNSHIVSNQVRYNLLNREVERELLPFAKKEKITIIAYSPLAQGILTGKYGIKDYPKDGARSMNRLFTPENLKRVSPLLEVLKEIAEKRGKSMAQVALNWLIKEPEVLAIAGAKNPKQVEENAGALGWRISEKELKAIEEAYKEIKLENFRSYFRIFLRTILNLRALT
ncbi:MAG: aldo/keto reductase [Nitrososphaerales archaeon]